MQTPPVLTIDGPSGSGKGTVGQWLANKLEWHFLDSGALYRLLALHTLNLSVPLDNHAAVSDLAHTLPVEFKSSPSGTAIWLAGVEVTQAIRSETCGNNASIVAAIGEVRQALLARQHAFLQAPGLVADGRDMGTVVFPQAFLKIFLEATPEARAERRYLQLKQQGLDGNLQDLVGEITRRDARDKLRTVAPLVPAEDALIIDTTQMSVDQVCAAILAETHSRLK